MPLDQVDVDKLPDKQGGAEMSFLDHLEVLRWHLVRSISVIVLVGVVVFMAKDFVFNTVILGPQKPDFVTYDFLCRLGDSLCMRVPEFTLLAREMGELFITHLKASIFLGFIIGFPYVLWEFWRFLKPGLYKGEQKAARGIVLICSSLFLMGVLFGYYVVAPFAVTFLVSYTIGATVDSAPTLASYVNYMVMFTIPTGLTFQLPVLIYFLTKIGLIGPKFLATYRRHAFVIILILAAIVTPPDFITQFLIGIPLYILYEVSIYVSKRVVKNKESQ